RPRGRDRHRQRQRRRHPARTASPALQSLRHHQGGGEGRRARAGDQPQHRRTPPGKNRCAVGGRKGDDLHHHAAGGAGGSGAGDGQCCNLTRESAMTTHGKILIVDDEPGVRGSLSRWFRDDGYEVGVAEGASEALTRLHEAKWDLALVDIRMPGTDGIELQRRMRQVDPELVVIMMTGYASVDTAVTALKNGAYDYITKPLDPDDVAHLVRNALAHRRSREENVRLREVVTAQASTDIIGQSEAMKKLLDSIETVAPTDATVLITGESGTGKEAVARAIHNGSPRRFHPMVAIHCGALTETLLESELFGHEKGAFTGAQYRKKGKFEMAEGGTVFLDEIGDISLKTQTDLLRVLQEREITRVGGHQPIKVDFRCIAATNKDLEAMTRDGRFRPD